MDDFLVRGSLRLANEFNLTHLTLAILNRSRRLAASKSSCSGLSMLRLVGVEDMSSDDVTTMVTMKSNTHKREVTASHAISRAEVRIQVRIRVRI